MTWYYILLSISAIAMIVSGLTLLGDGRFRDIPANEDLFMISTIISLIIVAGVAVNWVYQYLTI